MRVFELNLPRPGKRRPAGARSCLWLIFPRLYGFRSNDLGVVLGVRARRGPLRSIEPFPAVIAKEVFHDPIFQRMKSDDCNASSSFESCRKNTQTFLKCAKLVIHFHAQGLKSLRGWMTPTVPTNDFFNGAGERDGFADRGCLPPFNNHARDATRSRLRPEFAKQAGHAVSAGLVNNKCGRWDIPWSHTHIRAG